MPDTNEKQDQSSLENKMALEEDFELRDLLTETLEKNGSLAKIRAMLRATIYLALDEDPKLSQQEPLQNSKFQSYIKTADGKLMFNVVREFLEFFNLQETLMVYNAETSLGRSHFYDGKTKVQSDLGIDNTQELNIPILEHILQVAQSKSKILDINLNLSNVTSKKESLLNENSYASTFCESIESKLSSYNEENSKNNAKVNTMNSTYDLNSPTLNVSDIKNSTFVKNRASLESASEDESLNSPLSNPRNTTFQKSKISLESLQETVREEENLDQFTDKNLSIIKENIVDQHETVMPPLKLEETKLHLKEPKSLQEEFSELSILKNKQSLSSLTDLPPLTFNHNHSNDTLPLNNNKDMKDKSNLRELDKIFNTTEKYGKDPN